MNLIADAVFWCYIHDLITCTHIFNFYFLQQLKLQ